MNYTRDELKSLILNFLLDNSKYNTLDAGEGLVKTIELRLEELDYFDEELLDDLIEAPDTWLEQAQEAIREFYGENIPITLKGEKISYLERTIFSQNDKDKLGEGDLGKLVAFTGQLISTLKQKKARYKKIAWRCSDCGAITRVAQDIFSEKKVEPDACAACGKPRGKVKFALVQNESEMEDMLRFTLQEIEDENFAEMNCVLRDSRRINQYHLMIGEVYRVIGILRFQSDSERKAVGGYYIDVLGVQPVSEEEVEVTKEDMNQIKALAKNPAIVDILRAHIAPDVYGWEDVKEILLLQLVGAVDTYTRQGTTQTGNIHVLLIGDPGTAKTELLRSMMKIAPKAIDAMGTAASTAGLTAAAVKDPYTHEWAYVAGVFPLANGGIAVVDELDKLLKKEKDYAFLEALEVQEVTKQTAAGRVRLRTSFSFLGGANPKFGKWDDEHELNEQVDLTPQLFSRMDFIYVMRDVQNEALDRSVARYIIRQSTERVQLSNQVFKKYVAFARTVRPQMSDAAAKMLEDYFVELRKKDKYVTYRQARTLRKIATAYAKLRLKYEVDKEDARAAIDMYDRFLASWGYDTARFIEGMDSKRMQIRKEIILFLSTAGGSASWEELLVEVSSKTGYSEEEVRAILDKLVHSGSIKKSWPFFSLAGVEA